MFFINNQWKSLGFLLLSLTCLSPNVSATPEKVASSYSPKAIALNPPPLICQRNDKASSYQIQLSQYPDFPEEQTVTSEEKPWCFYNHHEPLKSGTWYWRHRHRLAKGLSEWSEVSTFAVLPNAVIMPTKSFDDFLAAIPTSHPRIGLAGKTPSEFRKQAKSHPYFDRLVAHCQKSLTSDRPSLDDLRQGYILTGDAAYARKGAPLLVERIKKYTPKDKFINIRTMGMLTKDYDAFGEYLDSDIRQMFLDKAKATLAFLNHNMSRVEQKRYDNHFWQMSAFGHMRIATTLAHEFPETHIYLEYIYGLLMAKHPILGPVDGGWANGHGYFHVNAVTIMNCAVDLQLGGVDLFNTHPWYKNTVKYLMYCTPAGAQVPGFGDKSESQSILLNDLVIKLLFKQAKHDPMAQWQLRRIRAFKTWKTKFTDWDYIVDGLVEEDWLNAPDPEPFPNAAAFSGVGLAALHSDMNGPAGKNIVAYLRSSPYGGSMGHMTSSQNCFNISYKGDKLFYHTGNYKAGFSSNHIFTDYRHTRSHNGMLVNGLSQGRGMHYAGEIKHFQNVDQMAYACGDASLAYGGVDDKAGEHWTGKHGLGYLEPLLTKYDRHMVLCRPNILVIYDEIEAKDAADFTLMFNSRSSDCELSDDGRFHVRSFKGEGVAEVFASQKVVSEYSNAYVTPFRDEKPSRASYKTTQKSTKVRFLTIIQMGDKGEFKPEQLTMKNGQLEVGDFMVKAELDETKPSKFSVLGNGAKLHVQNGRDPVLRGSENAGALTHSIKPQDQVEIRPISTKK